VMDFFFVFASLLLFLKFFVVSWFLMLALNGDSIRASIDLRKGWAGVSGLDGGERRRGHVE
jgi:hypothetical protein